MSRARPALKLVKAPAYVASNQSLRARGTTALRSVVNFAMAVRQFEALREVYVGQAMPFVVEYIACAQRGMWRAAVRRLELEADAMAASPSSSGRRT